MTPRGIRNNNPLNIKRGSRWVGLAAEQTDKVFCVFTSMDFGCRAAHILARRYIMGTAPSCRRVKRNTVALFIRHWCPDDTAAAYIHSVCSITGWQSNMLLDYRNRNQICYLLFAMAKVECGEFVPYHHFENGWGLAFSNNLNP